MTTLQQFLADQETEFLMRKPDEVLAFLRENSFLLPLIKEAVPHIHAIFGQDVTLELEFFSDYDHPHNPELFLVVWVKNLSAEAANAKLNRLDREWGIEADRRGQFKMNITVDFLR